MPLAGHSRIQSEARLRAKIEQEVADSNQVKRDDRRFGVRTALLSAVLALVTGLGGSLFGGWQARLATAAQMQTQQEQTLRAERRAAYADWSSEMFAFVPLISACELAVSMMDMDVSREDALSIFPIPARPEFDKLTHTTGAVQLVGTDDTARFTGRAVSNLSVLVTFCGDLRDGDTTDADERAREALAQFRAADQLARTSLRFDLGLATRSAVEQAEAELEATPELGAGTE